MYIDKLDDLVIKYNNTYQRTIKMKPVDVNQACILTSVEKIVKKPLNLKLMIMLEYQNKKIFLEKAMFYIDLKKLLWLKKFKILCRGHMLLVTLTNQKEFRVEKR